MAVETNGHFLRVQVKCTRFRRGRSYKCHLDSNGHPYTRARIDFIAAYVIPADTWYILPNLVFGNHDLGMYLVPSSTPLTVLSNTVAANQPPCCGNTTAEVQIIPIDGAVFQNNLIIADGNWSAFDCTSTSGPKTFTNNDVFSSGGSPFTTQCPDLSGGNGNVSVDPLFSDLLSDNFHLQDGSAVIRAGTTSASGEPKNDFDGDLRFINSSIDIGADEYSRQSAQTLSSYSLHFGSQDVGSTSAPQTLILTNNRKTAVAINLIAAGPSFSQSNNCGASLAAGTSCQINVSFSPLVGGSINSVLGVFTNATSNPMTVTLMGTGLAPQVQFGCCIYFYGTVVGNTSTSSEAITNSGTAPLLISSIVYSGPSDFVVTNDCPISPNSLAPGASCTLTVSYTPTIVGYESGTVTVNSNVAPAVTQRFELQRRQSCA